jgi:uncharacterized protein
MKLRLVFDTNTVISALVFAAGRLAWLRTHWRQEACLPLASRFTVVELIRVLSYPKFSLSKSDREELLGDYLPFCEIVDVSMKCPQACRDPFDQPFLDLAFSGGADVLVTGDKDLLVLAGQTAFDIESPESFRARISSGRSGSGRIEGK